MTANVYPSDYSHMKRFLCRFDSEGNCLFSRNITEQAGRGASLDRLAVDGGGGFTSLSPIRKRYCCMTVTEVITALSVTVLRRVRLLSGSRGPATAGTVILCLYQERELENLRGL